MYNSKLLI